MAKVSSIKARGLLYCYPPTSSQEKGGRRPVVCSLQNQMKAKKKKSCSHQALQAVAGQLSSPLDVDRRCPHARPPFRHRCRPQDFAGHPYVTGRQPFHLSSLPSDSISNCGTPLSPSHAVGIVDYFSSQPLSRIPCFFILNSLLDFGEKYENFRH